MTSFKLYTSVFFQISISLNNFAPTRNRSIYRPSCTNLNFILHFFNSLVITPNPFPTNDSLSGKFWAVWWMGKISPCQLSVISLRLERASLYHSILTIPCASARNLPFRSAAVTRWIFKISLRKHCRYSLWMLNEV